jgi:hypothetical protein
MESLSHVRESGCLMDICETDGWMDEVAHLQDLLVTRDLPSSPCEQADALLRLRRAHLFYPGVDALQQDVQVRCNFLTAGICESDFVDCSLHDSCGKTVLLSQALDHAGSERVLIVAGSGSW